MTPPIRVRKSRTATPRPWRVRLGKQILAAFPTGDEALDFVRRLIRAAA